MTGTITSGLIVAFLSFDGTIKLAPIAPVTETMSALGYSAHPALARGLGIITLLVCSSAATSASSPGAGSI